METDQYGYTQLRAEFLGLAYEYCRAKSKRGRGWEAGETEAGFAREQFDEVFTSDIENLMLEVICLVSAAGREPPEVRKIRMVRAEEFLLRVGEINLAGLVGDDDASELLCDLKMLGLLSA